MDNGLLHEQLEKALSGNLAGRELLTADVNPQISPLFRLAGICADCREKISEHN
jgi:hypothetical protein